ncbi:hypothetical protein ACT3SP_17925 [Brachybacterium sp. AOP43-C2-M15]|uniref:hypothetical protein n=1 Tax=Brachybacterium sp. AOP43-C2-M15 TaxID=3457661 RepID=UPI004033CF6F
MPETGPGSAGSRRTWLAGGAALLVALAVIIGIAVVRGGGDGDPSATSPSSAAPSPPPFPAAPVSHADVATLTVPEETRFAQSTFWAEAGTTYAVTMDLRSTKPEGSGGRSMYLGVTLSCSPQAGGPGISVGGTQNMLTGEETEYRNQGLISVPEDGPIDCSIKASAPYDDVASDGTTFAIDGTWRAEQAEDGATEAPEDGLPRNLADDAVDDVLLAEVPLEELGEGELRALASLHLTTCTIVNGSREDDRAWCSKDDLDEAGSTASVELRAELVDAGGEVCEVLGEETTEPDYIDLYRHHRLLSLELVETVPGTPCGDTVRVSASVHNDGPAPLVVHRSNSSLVVVGE